MITTAGVRLSADKTRIAALAGLFAAELITTAALLIHTTRRGKFGAWADVLANLGLRRRPGRPRGRRAGNE